MRLGFPHKVERSSGDAEAWISVGSVDRSTFGTSAVLIVEAPFSDGSGTEQLLRVELEHEEAAQLAEWLTKVTKPRSFR